TSFPSASEQRAPKPRERCWPIYWLRPTPRSTSRKGDGRCRYSRADPFSSGQRSDDSTGDARATVAGGIRHLIVRTGVDDQRTAIAVEQAGGAGRERDPRGGERDVGDTARGHRYVRIVTGVRTVGILQSVLLPHRIVVPARAGERRRGAAVAFTDFVEMDSVLAGGKRQARDFHEHRA